MPDRNLAGGWRVGEVGKDGAERVQAEVELDRGYRLRGDAYFAAAFFVPAFFLAGLSQRFAQEALNLSQTAVDFVFFASHAATFLAWLFSAFAFATSGFFDFSAFASAFAFAASALAVQVVAALSFFALQVSCFVVHLASHFALASSCAIAEALTNPTTAKQSTQALSFISFSMCPTSGDRYPRRNKALNIRFRGKNKEYRCGA